MRTVLLALLAILCAPPLAAAAPPRSAIFYYPWYGAPARDGAYEHWSQSGHAPPVDIASNFYPARGAYSSSNPAVLQAQMRDIAGAGVGEVVSSWWGWGSPEDLRLPAVIKAAWAVGLQVAVHIEPYDGRSASSVATDIAHLRELGVSDFYVYRAADIPAVDWAALNGGVTGVRVFAQTNLPGFAAAGKFTGLYTYDVLLGAGNFGRICAEAHKLSLLCAPSVGPGYQATAATGDARVKPRLHGYTYDGMWRAALAAGADMVTITSYNEWGEGTQIEPASSRGSTYETYDGSYGLTGKAAQRAYLIRTAYWTARLG